MSKDPVASDFYKVMRYIFYFHAVKSYFDCILGLEACKMLDLIRKVDIFYQLNVTSKPNILHEIPDMILVVLKSNMKSSSRKTMFQKYNLHNMQIDE